MGAGRAPEAVLESPWGVLGWIRRWLGQLGGSGCRAVGTRGWRGRGGEGRNGRKLVPGGGYSLAKSHVPREDYFPGRSVLGKRGLFLFANDLLLSQCGRLSPRAALPAGSRRVLRKVRDGTRCRQRVTGGQNGLRWLHSESPARRGARELTFRCVSREQADRKRPQKIQRGPRGDRHEQQEDSADLLAGPS